MANPTSISSGKRVGNLNVSGFILGDKNKVGIPIGNLVSQLTFLGDYHRKFLQERLLNTTGKELRENLGNKLAEYGQLLCDGYEFAVETFHGPETFLKEVPKFIVRRGGQKFQTKGSFDKEIPRDILPIGARIGKKGAHIDDFGLSVGFSIQGGKYSDFAVEVAHQREFGRTIKGHKYIKAGSRGAMVIPLYGTGHQIASGSVDVPEQTQKEWASLPAKYRYSAASRLMRRHEGFGGDALKHFQNVTAMNTGGGKSKTTVPAGRWVQQEGGRNVKAIFVVDTARLYSVGKEAGNSPFAIYGGGAVHNMARSNDARTLNPTGGGNPNSNNMLDESDSSQAVYGIDVTSADFNSGNLRWQESGTQSAEKAEARSALSTDLEQVNLDFGTAAQMLANWQQAPAEYQANTKDIAWLKGRVGQLESEKRRYTTTGIVAGTLAHKIRMLSAINLRMGGGTMANLHHEIIGTVGILPNDPQWQVSNNPFMPHETSGLGGKFRKSEKLFQKYDVSGKYQGSITGKDRKLAIELPYGITHYRRDVIRVAGVSREENAFKFGFPMKADGAPLSNYMQRGVVGGVYGEHNPMPKYNDVLRDIASMSSKETTYLMTAFGVTVVSGKKGNHKWQDTALANTFSIQGNNNNMVNKTDKTKKSRVSRLASRIGVVDGKESARVSVLQGANLTSGDVHTQSYAKYKGKSARAHGRLLESMKLMDMPIGIIDSAPAMETSITQPGHKYRMGGIRKYTPLFAAVHHVRVGKANGHMQTVIKETGGDDLAINYEDLVPRTKRGELDKRFSLPWKQSQGGVQMKINKNSILTSWVENMQG